MANLKALFFNGAIGLHPFGLQKDLHRMPNEGAPVCGEARFRFELVQIAVESLYQ